MNEDENKFEVDTSVPIPLNSEISSNVALCFLLLKQDEE
jgi:hypothetical protein